MRNLLRSKIIRLHLTFNEKAPARAQTRNQGAPKIPPETKPKGLRLCDM